MSKQREGGKKNERDRCGGFQTGVDPKSSLGARGNVTRSFGRATARYTIVETMAPDERLVL